MLTISFVFQCPWPIGYEELTFFPRTALTCDWNKELPPPIGIPEGNMSMSMELLLYTPPVTPGEELSKESTDSANTECSLSPTSENKLDETLLKDKVIHSTKEPTGSLPVLELSELESNNFIEERRNSTKEKNTSASTCKTLPKIINIQKTNLDITFLSKSDKCDNEKIYKHNHLPIDLTMTDIAENTLFNNTLCEKIDLDTQCKRGSKQNKNSKVQLDDKMNGTETHFNTETLSVTDEPLFDANDINNQNTTNNSSSNVPDVSLNIDKILEDILSTENYITENTNNDWLDSLVNM